MHHPLQLTKDYNTRHLMKLTGKDRKQAARRLNDLLSQVTQTLWPAFDYQVEPDSPKPRGAGSGGGGSGGRTPGSSATNFETEITQLNQALRNAIGARHELLEAMTRVQGHNTALRQRLQTEVTMTQVCMYMNCCLLPLI